MNPPPPSPFALPPAQPTATTAPSCLPPHPPPLCRPAASNAFSLLQSIVLKNSKVKQVLGLPDLSKVRKAGAAAAGSSQAELVGKPVVTFTQKPPQPQKQPPKQPQKPRQGSGKKHAAAAAAAAATAAAASK